MLTTAYCPERGDQGHRFVTDHSQGHIVCAECGLVQQERIIDQTSEWRNFAAQNQTGSNNPNRVGGPINPLFSDFGVSTRLQDVKGDSGFSKWTLRASMSSSDRTISKAIEYIRQAGSQIDLPNPVTERAIEMYKLMFDLKKLRGKNSWAIVAAVIIWASRWQHCPKDVKDVIKATSTKKKEVYSCYKVVKEFAKDKYNESPINSKPMDWVVSLNQRQPIYCTNLNIMGKLRTACQEICKKTHEQEIVEGKNPRSIASASIYMVALLEPSLGINVKKIAEVANLSDTTIRNLYRDMHIYRYELIPSWYKNQDEIKRMPQP